ncbi:hypothetical protein ACTXI9_01705 [Brachybacterium alimentarium]|uniref:hypothetical protein n=1 Tax=Brachybacterium alimentarium TaxID=47845 RepID=UPI003FD2BE84
MTTHPKPARVDLGDGDSLILFRTDDWHTTVRFHSANPDTSLAGAVMATDALRDALDEIAPAQEAEDGQSGSDFWCERWAEAACQRDDAQAYAALWKETARRAISDRDFANMASRSFRKVAQEHYERALKAERERDEAVERAANASPRPLTADDITDETAAKVAKALGDLGHGWVPSHYMHDALVIALTEPPSRPEWEDAPYVWADSAQGEGRVIWKRSTSDDGRVIWSSSGTWHPSWMLTNPAPVAPEGVRVVTEEER